MHASIRRKEPDPQHPPPLIYRRTGDPKRAVATLEPLPGKEGIPDGFLEWIKDELAKAKAG